MVAWRTSPDRARVDRHFSTDCLTEGAPMSELWQTIEQAAVTLGLSVRTVNRHITAGKLQSRLFEGRREVLVPLPQERPRADRPTMAGAPSAAGASAGRAPAGSAATDNGSADMGWS